MPAVGDLWAVECLLHALQDDGMTLLKVLQRRLRRSQALSRKRNDMLKQYSALQRWRNMPTHLVEEG